MQDLSHMAANGPWVTSQAGGNMTSSNEQAMTGPGSKPVDPLPDRTDQGDPSLDMPAETPAGSPKPRSGSGSSYTPSPVSWKDVQ